MSDLLTILGSGGARVVMASQVLATGGLWLELDGVTISLDPGPGSLVHAINHQLKPADLSAVLISHRHLDHCGDVNAMVEAMTMGGLRHQGMVFAPLDALQGDPVILKYLRHYVDKVETLEPLHEYKIKGLPFETSMAHNHGPATTFGFIFNGRKKIAYLPDTFFFPELLDFYRGDVLVVSMLLVEPNPRIAHLSVPDVLRIVSSIKPEVTIITHFGRQIIAAGPQELAEHLQQATGKRVIAARDGMRLDLETLEEYN